MKILILEDDKNRVSQFRSMFVNHDIRVTEYAEVAKRLLDIYKYDFIFLDHDLGGEQMVDSSHENTGYQVAKMIDRTENITTPIIIHSWNSVGAQNMYDVLNNGKRQVAMIKFGMFDSNIIKQN